MAEQHLSQLGHKAADIYKIAGGLTVPSAAIIGPIAAYLAFVSALGFGLWNHLTSLFPVNLLAGYRFLVPICAVVESSLFVSGESPGVGIWIGGVLVLAALVGLQRFRAR